MDPFRPLSRFLYCDGVALTQEKNHSARSSLAALRPLFFRIPIFVLIFHLLIFPFHALQKVRSSSSCGTGSVEKGKGYRILLLFRCNRPAASASARSAGTTAAASRGKERPDRSSAWRSYSPPPLLLSYPFFPPLFPFQVLDERG